ncbi:PAS domain S-box protein [Caldimonas tepidiphila]|uniref:PAS domain S-box protein n=1 Tax=Caldimonas tepidiphila TaxID=2315841 RepID=UPI000E5C0210|nr:PAS domain S-box protein [Caldimonas tepidiphila]
MSQSLVGQSRDILEKVIDSALDAFVLIDSDSIVIAWTRQATVMFGWSSEEAVGQSISELIIPPGLRQAHHAGMRRYLETGQHAVIGRRIEINAQHKDGRIFPVELAINVADIDGRRIFSAALRDITERRALEEQYRFTFEKAPIGIAHLTPDGKILRANPKAGDILGYSMAELADVQTDTLSHPDDREIALAPLRALQSGAEESVAYEKRFFHKSGRIVWLKISLSMLRESGPSQGTIMAVFDDITEAKLAHERAEQLAAVLEATPDFVGFANVTGQALYINRAGREMVGLPLDKSLAGVSIKEKYPPWAYEIVRKGIEHALKEGSWKGESALISASGKEIPTSQVIIAHKDRDGRPNYISTIIRDIAERYRTEQALREMDRRKDEFLAMLAHELRNPLAPIGTAAQILKLKGLDEARVGKASEVIARQVEHMTELINDLLDVSRVTRGLIEIESEPVDLGSVLADAIEQSRPLIEGQQHHLVVHPAAEPLAVRGDKTRLVQMLANLLNNAAKYTRKGGEIVLGITADADHATISVQDNGIGIPPDVLPHVFDLFTQAKRSPDRSQGGLGLGLALVKSLVELHGGTVTARSDGPGKGSEFSVRLPRLHDIPAIAGAAKERPAEREGGRKLSVMVVDDNVDAAQTLAVLIESQGHEVTVVHDARDALERARVSRPKVLLLDIGLPDMDGYELARCMRSVPGLADSLLIALTGYGQAEDLEKSKAAGFDHHLLKPADTGRLLSLLEASAAGGSRH